MTLTTTSAGKASLIVLSTCLSKTICALFAGYIFGNFRDEASVIIQRYAVHRLLFIDPKICDLEST